MIADTFYMQAWLRKQLNEGLTTVCAGCVNAEMCGNEKVMRTVYKCQKKHRSGMAVWEYRYVGAAFISPPSMPKSSRYSLLLPLPFPLSSCSCSCCAGERFEERDDDAWAAKLLAGASQIRMVKSSEQDANICLFLGFHATEFTLPTPWPDKTSSRTPRSRCQTYTLPSRAMDNIRGWENAGGYSEIH